MKKILIIVTLLLPITGFSQGELKIHTGAHLVMNGSPSLIVNSDFTNDGTFEAGSGTVVMAGSSALTNTKIGGNTFTRFYNLEIAKPLSGQDVELEANMEVENHLQMVSGMLDLNGNDVSLTGIILGESEFSRIVGPNGGEILKTVDLNMPASENPGNMGLSITSNQNLGTTYVIRGHTPMTINGSSSINRYFEVIPDLNNGLDATVRFDYFDGELEQGTHVENQLQQFYGSGQNWTEFATSQSDLGSNWIEAEHINDFAFITLANGSTPPLPIELISFDAKVNDDKHVELSWATENEFDNDFFTIERSKDAITFELVTTVDGAGNSVTPIYYETLDRSPYSGTSYYRLKQTDFDGSFSYSEIKSVKIDTDFGFEAFPNPFTNELELSGTGLDNEEITIELVNVIGQILHSEKIIAESADFNHTVQRLNHLPAGNYILSINTGVETESFKMLKVD